MLLISKPVKIKIMLINKATAPVRKEFIHTVRRCEVVHCQFQKEDCEGHARDNL
jgi:hypothetical protein